MSDFSLILPEPEIKLYEEGFVGNCKLNRAVDGQKLSTLVERIEQPMVVAIDAPWGAGKSFFLKCWVGAHTLENKGKAKTVYFDAFQHDFMDDPLIGLTGCISERFDQDDKVVGTWQKIKEAASKLSAPASRIGLAVATSGATEVAGAVVDAGLKAGSKELETASKEFWRKEDGRRAAMSGFREALIELTTDCKLVIVVDELDRCRPDYALSVLEVTKHFFNVPNVHFVLGVNLKELANSVRARYGAQVQGEKYLQKFVTISMPLVPKRSRFPSGRAQLQHFQWVCSQVGLARSWEHEWLEDYFRFVDHHAGLSLRDVEKIATLALVTPNPSSVPPAKNHLYIGALILKVVSPLALEKARSGQLQSSDVCAVLNVREYPKSGEIDRDIYAVWNLVTRQENHLPNSFVSDSKERLFADRDPVDLLREVVAETLDTFEVHRLS